MIFYPQANHSLVRGRESTGEQLLVVLGLLKRVKDAVTARGGGTCSHCLIRFAFPFRNAGGESGGGHALAVQHLYHPAY
ncbi:MAG: hypothetical protein JWM99_2894 [Verrucomicrobiales bacterium]|nr:hypothetical protein [Verrucomicrobiales bacterium]